MRKLESDWKFKYELKLNFRSSTSDVTVNIGGVACVVQTVANTKVVCVTGARNSGSIDAQVELQINGGGNARQVYLFY